MRISILKIVPFCELLHSPLIVEEMQIWWIEDKVRIDLLSIYIPLVTPRNVLLIDPLPPKCKSLQRAEVPQKDILPITEWIQSMTSGTSLNHHAYYQWHKYCSLSHVSILFSLRTGKKYDKKHFINSIDTANFYGTHLVIFCCISFRSQVMKVWKNESNTYGHS